METKSTPYSSLKIFAHPEKLQALKEGKRVAPLYIRIKPTNFCNHDCYYCHYAKGKYLDLEGQEANNQIPWPKMQEIINDLGDMGVKAVTFSGGGEPLIYPKIVETITLINKKNIDLSIITNGHLLKGERAEVLKNAKWVRISLDSANDGTYSKIRNIPISSFDEVCNNIKNFAKMKASNCELGINFVINHENADQVYQAGKLMHDLGVNHIKYTARITNDVDEYHKPFKSSVIEQIHRLKNEVEGNGFSVINLYETDFELCTKFKRSYSNCVIKEFVCVIAADCKVYFCHDKAYLANGVIGDLNKVSFKELWFSEETKELFKNFDASKECNHHCVYDERNILANAFLTLNENHINFI